MTLTPEEQAEFHRLAEPMALFLRANCHPHTLIVIDCNSAQLLEGVVGVNFREPYEATKPLSHGHH